ncbi:hypothetical protein PM082_023949 [Marasmius tenuissimus]|nr:hypothetical protein PM082_004726 [Marasmius tenuissimus]KAJ8092346.1 hypothetical protein PM082_023949 [Marasmius tenuissimus]
MSQVFAAINHRLSEEYPRERGYMDTCEGEPFWGETVAFVEVAFVPFGVFEVDEGEIGEGIEAVAEGDATGGCGAEGVVVVGVEGGVEVEVFLDVDDVEQFEAGGDEGGVDFVLPSRFYPSSSPATVCATASAVDEETLERSLMHPTRETVDSNKAR